MVRGFIFIFLSLIAASSCFDEEGEHIEAEGLPVHLTAELDHDAKVYPKGIDSAYIGKELFLEKQSKGPCCSPDFTFIIDVTDGAGFTHEMIKSNVREFLVETIDKAAPKECDIVHAALIEYGSVARIRWDFNTFGDVKSLKKALSQYTPGKSLGDVSNAQAGFTAAKILLTNSQRGRRSTSTSFVFWLTHSTPLDSSRVLAYANTAIKTEAYVIVVGVKSDNEPTKLDFDVIKSIATSPDYAFLVDGITKLVLDGSNFFFDYCPMPVTMTTTMAAATSITQTEAPTSGTEAPINSTHPPQNKNKGSADECPAVLWLPFDRDTKDYSRNNFLTFLNGEVEHDATTFAQGAGSLLFKRGHLSIPGLRSHDFRNSASFCAFFKLANGSNGGGILSNHNNNTHDFTVAMGTQSANTFTAMLNFWDPVGTQIVKSTFQAPANCWNHACVIYNGNEIRLFMNGALADAQFVGGSFSVVDHPFLIGYDSVLSYFDGHIDDVLITACPMTQEEIEAHRHGNCAFLNSHGFALTSC